MAVLSLFLLTTVMLSTVLSQDAVIPDDLEAHFTVLEESAPQIFVGNVAVGAGLNNVFNSSVLQQLQFGFLPQPERGSNNFLLDTFTGDIRTNQTINREDICTEEEQCVVDLSVAIVKPTEFFQVIVIHIDVEDINDMSPAFNPSRTQIVFSELDPIGTTQDLPPAVDLDSPQFGIKEYRLGMSTPQFSIRQVRNPINGRIDLKLVLEASLDREQRDFYALRIEALDYGNPPMIGNLIVDVLVDDDNDHKPTFSSNLYELEVLEDFLVNVGFFAIQATDNDQGENGVVVYGFSTRTQTLLGDIFTINHETGVIALQSPLDYENEEVYHLEVMATDQGAKPLSAMTTVIVNVVDVNDNVPRIEITALTSATETRAEIEENLPPGKLTAHVSVFDEDSSNNGQVTCSMDHALFDLQSLRTHQYKIVTAAALDHESARQYVLTVVCSDRGDRPLSARRNMTIIVLDKNDNAPSFLQTRYSGVVPENITKDSYLLQVNATDLDTGSNAAISYELVSTDMSRYVRIDQNTGVITATKDLDYEDVPILNLTIRARDHGSPPLSDTVPVTIHVLDVNDEAPAFLRSTYVFYVSENMPQGTFIGTVTASDPDSPPYNIFDYSIFQPNSQEEVMFYINTKNGNLYATEPMDREHRSTFVLSVLATDIDNPTFVGTTTVTIIIRDENDNSPVVHFPMDNNSTFTISPSVPQGYNITKIFATDPDTGPNSNITFSITSGNYDNTFRIDRNHGYIQTNQDVSGIEYQEFSITIRIEDMGDPVMHTNLEVIIVIDKGVPYFTSNPPPMVKKNNLNIIIAVAAISGFVIVALIIAIVVLKTTDCRQTLLARKHRHRDSRGQRVFSDINVKAVEAHGYLQQAAVSGQGRQSVPTLENDLAPDVLRHPKMEHDSDSLSSTNVSNTDSGKGASEEGGGDHRKRDSRHNLPCEVHRNIPLSGNHSNQPPSLMSSTQLYYKNEDLHGYQHSPRTPSSGPPSYPGSHLSCNVPTLPKKDYPSNSGAHGYHSNPQANSDSHSSLDGTTSNHRYGNKLFNYKDESCQGYSHQGNQQLDAWERRPRHDSTKISNKDSDRHSNHLSQAGPKKVIHAVNV